MLAVDSPAYLATPSTIGKPQQLREHNCIRIRSIANGAVPPGRFKDGTSSIDVRVGGSVSVDTTTLALAAALDGAGIVYLGSNYLVPYLRSGQLVAVLEDWAIARFGSPFCYAGRHQVPHP